MKSKEWLRRKLPLLLVLFCIFAIVVVIRSFKLPETEKQPVVGLVLIGEKADRGWNESHYDGLSSACERYGCVLRVREHVPEDERALDNAVEELIGEGVNAIYLTSFGYGQYVDRIAKQHPHIAFFSISGKGKEKNCTTYFSRLYQARYLAGIVAGSESRTGVLGYVTATPNAQANRSINAYALGMRVANPEARLIVRFINSWENEEEERASVALLASRGADVITYHEDRPHAVREAEELGLFSIGYDSVYERYSERFLTAALYDWTMVYRRVLGDYLSGRTNTSRNYWLDIAEGGVKLYPLSPLVQPWTIALVKREEKRIMTNWDVFSGVIRDNQGNLRCKEGERISDRELFTGMDWFVEGVEIYE